MKILVLNRRDIGNPAGGGAEIYTHEIARGLVLSYGCEVEVFASAYTGCSPQETIDGVKYIREGNEVSVHLRGCWYALRNKSRYDLVIDEFNGIGFFTFILPNSLLLIHQLYKEFWFREIGIAGMPAYLFEPLFLWFYRNKRTITVSPSTYRDLEKIGFRDVRIVMNALKRSPATGPARKDSSPVLTFLGRLKSTKRPEDAIEIFRKVKAVIPAAKLWIIGRGPEENGLKKMSDGMSDIKFWGWVREEEKNSLLRETHILIVPGVREGFGINVIEAAYAGAPAIGYDVPGLRDSIRNGKTGYLVGSPSEAAERIIELLNDRKKYKELSTNCLEYARDFKWEKRVDEFWDVIKTFAKN